MMHYEGILADDYRLAKILEIHPYSRGIVRTVTIGYRRRNKREKAKKYQCKPLVEEQVAVQRLCLLVPNDEKF